MANNAMTLFDNRPTIPADVASFFEEESNIVPRETVPSLSYEGKTWSISLNGEKTKLMRKNQDGDEEPLSVMRVVILDYNKKRGRAYYEGAYDPTKKAMPICWSDDGVAPPDTVPKKQAEKCDKCPMSVKGSKITEQGKAVVACSEHRMIVVVPAHRLDFEPLRLKLAITSDWDGQSPDHVAQGWYAFKNYLDFLQTKGVLHTSNLITKMKFDPNTAYPKVLFSADNWLGADKLREIIPIVKSEKVKALAAGSWTPNGVDGVKQIAEKAEPETTPVKVEEKTVVEVIRAAKAEEDDDGGDVALPGAKVEAKPATPAAAAPKAAAPKAAAKAAAPKARPPADAPAPVANGSDDLNSLLADWS